MPPSDPVVSLSGTSEKRVCVAGQTASHGVQAESLARSLPIAKWKGNAVVAESVMRVLCLGTTVLRAAETLRMRWMVIDTNLTAS